MAMKTSKMPASWSNKGEVEQLRTDAFDSLTRMLPRAVAETDTNFSIWSALRTHADQVALFKANYTPTSRGRKYSTDRSYQGRIWARKAGGVSVASPDLGSNHQDGCAVDIHPGPIQEWIKANGLRFGWSWDEGRRVGENWHFRYIASKDTYTSEGRLNHYDVQRAVGAGVDGKIGTGTVKLIKAFQKANGLEVDGKVGPKTKAVMLGKAVADAVDDTASVIEDAVAESAEPGWMPGADRSLTWSGNAHKVVVRKIVLHTTEGGSLPNYQSGGVAPHFTVFPDGRVYQHIPTTQSSKALAHPSGTVETNNAGCIQIEYVGSCDREYAAKNGLFFTEDANNSDLAGLASVLAWISAAHGIPLTADGLTWPTTNAAYASAPQRMTDTEWQAYAGVCGHTHVPHNCVHPETPVLLGDLTWKRAGDLATGDRLVGFDEESPDRSGRRFTDARAIVHGEIRKDSYRVGTVDGRSVIASADHKWLVRNTSIQHGPRSEWVETRNLDLTKHEFLSIGQRWSESQSKESGWIAGAIDCDGAIVASQENGTSVVFGQSEGRTDVMDRFKAYLDERALPYWSAIRAKTSGYKSLGAFTDLRVKGGFWATMRFLAETGPSKFDAVRDGCWVGRTLGKATDTVRIERLEHVGEQPLVSLESTTKTYIADGLLSHNTHWDPGALPIARLLELAGGAAPATGKPSTPSTGGTVTLPDGKALLMKLKDLPDFPLLRTAEHKCYYGDESKIESVSGKSPNSLNPGEIFGSGKSSGARGLKAWQKKMGLTADGRFGAKTEAAARKLQKAAGLTVDGKIGPTTFYAAWLVGR